MISLSDNRLGRWPILQDHQCHQALHYSFLSWSCAKITKRPGPCFFPTPPFKLPANHQAEKPLQGIPRTRNARGSRFSCLRRAPPLLDILRTLAEHSTVPTVSGVQTVPCRSYDLCGPPSGNTMQQKGGRGFKDPLSALTQPSSSNPSLSSTRNGHSAIFPDQPLGSRAPLGPPSRSSTAFLDQLIKSLGPSLHLPSTFHKGSRKN